MKGEWPAKQLEEVAELSGGFAFKSEDYSSEGRFVLRTLNIKDDGSIHRNDAVFLPLEKCHLYKRFELQEHDTLFVMVGATLGKVGYVRQETLPALLNQNMWRIRGRDGLCDKRYLQYAFRHTVAKNLGWASGSARDFVRRDDYRTMEIPVPPLAEQKAIAAVLGALDDKIELNRRMNATLEAIARAIFRSWFVDFDPVRSNMDRRGRPSPQPSPTGRGSKTLNPPLPLGEGRGEGRFALDPATADLFPEHLEDSPLGHIPKGWIAGTVSDAFNFTMGQSPPGDTYNREENGIPFYQGCSDFGFRFPTRRVFCTAPTRYANAGDTLVSVRAPVGDINMANEDCCIGRGVAAVRHKTGAKSFTYHAMANLEADFAKFEAEGTVFGSINKQNFENLRFVIPPPEIVAAYERQAAPLDEQIYNLEHQSRTLATLRDTLLPKLLSGELDLSEYITPST